MKKVLTVLGARPQFIKASVVSRAMKQSGLLREVVVHTGQHFDANMSDIFFRDLEMNEPSYNLDINGGTHGSMTGRMLVEVEQVILSEKPDLVLVYGDTNSTLAGALAAVKLHIPVAHVEAGLRSFNMAMPEEVNRILTDQVSRWLFCPTDTAITNLEKEGFSGKNASVIKVGDVMQDAALLFAARARQPTEFSPGGAFILATLHRAENTDDPERLAGIVSALNALHAKTPVVIPLHPRTRATLSAANLKLETNTIEPVGYLEMLWLLSNCRLVITDSGGLQKEAFFFHKPCVTTRDQTEWTELLDLGVNSLAGSDREKIIDAAERMLGVAVEDHHAIYGGGMAANGVVSRLTADLCGA